MSSRVFILYAPFLLLALSCKSESSKAESSPQQNTQATPVQAEPKPVKEVATKVFIDAGQTALASEKHVHEEHAPEKHAHGGHGNHPPLGHRFQDADKWAKRFDSKKRDAWQKPKSVIAYMNITEGMHVADIGAGTGYFLPYLSRAVGAKGTVLGLDIEKDMVRYMKERAIKEKLSNVSAQVVSTTDPAFPPGSMDRILIVDTWHHLPLRVEYAKKMATALSEKGSIVVVDFTMKTTRGPKKSHKLAVGTVVAELKKAGLTTEILNEDLPDQYIVVARKK